MGVIIGTHLVEPFINLTSGNVGWEKLMQAFPQLYEDLCGISPVKLLDLDNPAFKFVSKERFFLLSILTNY